MKLVMLLRLVVLLSATLASGRLTCHVKPPPAGQYATATLHDAISRCSRRGGTVQLAPGVYRTAALLISGTVAIHVPRGAVIEAGNRKGDYPGPQAHWYALRFHNCTGCRLLGEGSIDGRGRAWVLGSLPDRKLVRNFKDPSCTKAEECRPRLVGVEQSSNVEISGITLTDPVYWSLHIIESSQIVVSNLTIVSDFDIANTDGIDIDSSSDVEVTGCTIATADDAVCLKTTRPGRATERVTVRGCSLKSRSSAVKLGSESRADFRDITFQDLQIVDSHRGLAIQLRDEGSMHNVSFDNIATATRYYNQTWWGGAEPIYVVATPRTATTQVGSAADLRFNRITALGENGFFIAGAAGRRVTNLTISSTTLDLVKRTGWLGGSQDYRPGIRGLVHSGATAPLWLEHAERVTLDDVKVSYHAPFREDWETTPHVDPASTAGVSFKDFAIDGLLARPTQEVGSLL